MLAPITAGFCLRDPEYTALGREEGIGPMLIEATPESDADRQAFGQQVKETFTALDGLAGIPPEKVPTVIVSKDCFGFKGTVRVLIYSGSPFRETPHE